jgi:hypothetical protein
MLRMPLREIHRWWALRMRLALSAAPYGQEFPDQESKAMRRKKRNPCLRHQPLYQFRLQLAVHEKVTGGDHGGAYANG